MILLAALRTPTPLPPRPDRHIPSGTGPREGIPRRIFPIPPATSIFDQGVIDVGAIGQKHISKGASVLVEAVRQERDFFSEDQL